MINFVQLILHFCTSLASACFFIYLVVHINDLYNANKSRETLVQVFKKGYVVWLEFGLCFFDVLYVISRFFSMQRKYVKLMIFKCLATIFFWRNFRNFLPLCFLAFHQSLYRPSQSTKFTNHFLTALVHTLSHDSTDSNADWTFFSRWTTSSPSWFQSVESLLPFWVSIIGASCPSVLRSSPQYLAQQAKCIGNFSPDCWLKWSS